MSEIENDLSTLQMIDSKILPKEGQYCLHPTFPPLISIVLELWEWKKVKKNVIEIKTFKHNILNWKPVEYHKLGLKSSSR